ncbi:hypothetical protein M0813_30245 [Anaeramoeba flamelloides]|uniref:DOCKER domain-containing protein n=1 Tax=Anaeramoeba flamelloides TaxID=1746091 RepID=A0ABQ8XL03_9EUKA|nr:hypothetical protein M0813_30245 [Anaeramoeba flamelloides]
MLLDRKKLIKIELSKLSPYSNKMQQLLSGTLLPQVNEGIIKIADQFLTAENIIFHKKLHIDKLKIAFNKLLDTCEIAIQNTKFKVKMEQIQLHQAISHGLHITKKKIYPYLTGKTIKEDNPEFKISTIVNKINFDKNVIGNFKD